MRRLLIVTAACALLLGALTGCAKLNSAETGTMSVRMTDAPGDFQSVNISLIQVAAKYEAESAPNDPKGNSSWTVLWQGSRMCDLLQLRNGVFTSLGEGRLPAGEYNRLRMLFGNGSNVVVSGVQHPLQVPAEGIKLNGRFDVPANGNVDIALDFDVAKSIVLEDGVYKLKPVIRVFTTEPHTPQPGAIAGIVIARGTLTWVFAIQGADTVTSTTAGEDGHFQLSLLPAGNYAVAFAPVAGYEGRTLPEVVVTAGNITNVGSIELAAVAPPPPPPPAPGAINGQILSGSSPPTLFVLQGADTVRQVNVVDEYFTVEGLAPGTYSLLVRAAGYEDATRPGVAVNTGETTYIGTIELVELPPPPPGNIIGRVVPAGLPTTVQVFQNGVMVTSAICDMDGTFKIVGVPAGHYTLVFHPEFDYSDTTMEVDVQSGATTDVGDVPIAA